jgi:hypothetical protein
MATEAKTILLIRRPGSAAPDLAAPGYRVVERDLGAVPPVDSEMLDAIVLVPDPVDAAVAETRRQRVDFGERYRPIYWLGPAEETTALDAGADAVLSEPFAQSLAVKLIAGRRIRTLVEDLRNRAGQVELLGEMLAKSRAIRTANLEFARSSLRLSDAPPPERFHDLHIEAIRIDEPDTTVIDAVEFGTTLRIVVVRAPGRLLAGTLTAMLVRQLALTGREEPGESLRRINRVLAERQTEFLPAATAILDLDGLSNEFRLAQSGLANAIVESPDGSREAIPFAESHLGIFENVYPTRCGRLAPGAALHVGESPILAVIVRRRHLP